MITFPPEYVEIYYPGYYWNMKENVLYSIKVTGTLKPLKLGRRWNGPGHYSVIKGYKLSHRGRPRFMPLEDLMKLSPKNAVVPMWNQLNLPI